MSEIVTTKFTGWDELQKKLEALPEDLAKKTMRTALGAGGDVMRDGMVAAAPEDTGFLKEHFNVKISVKDGGLVGKCFVGPAGKIDYPNGDGGYRDKVNRKGKTYQIGRISVASVARFLEFGTSKMGKKPFMTQAFETKKGTALDAMIEKLKAWLILVSK
jgi:HK97 gp10 family phage protein